ncbi:Stemmadenine O-acetyltransferase [Linum perenne]
MEVVVTSKENIKPTSSSPPTTAAEVEENPTKRHPFKLCLLDQLIPPCNVPLILFYTPNETCTIETMSKKLKSSLSQTLTLFYPLSGRVKDSLIVDDFDAGVPFIESRVMGHRLSEFLQPPKLELLSHLIPTDPLSINELSPQVMVQMNTFECGGIAIGFSFSHQITDGATMSAFLNTWAARCRKLCIENVTTTKDLSGGSSVFPPLEFGVHSELLYLKDKLWPGRSITSSATRRFVFCTDAVEALKSLAKSRIDGVEINPSRSEAVGAFIWESVIAAAAITDSPKPMCLKQSVNIRPYMKNVHPLCEHSIGNIFLMAVSFCSDDSTRASDLVQAMREGLLRCVDENSLSVLCSSKGFDAMVEGVKQLQGIDSPNLMYTSWLRFGFSDVNFGWGTPIWSSLVGETATGAGHPNFPNVVIIKELAAAEETLHNGIEAWIVLDATLMSSLEKDPSFLKFASSNPPIHF